MGRTDMYLRDLMVSLLRRWYLFIVALVLTAGAAFGVLNAVAPTYKQSASVVLLPPMTPGEPDTNRYLGLSSVGQAVDVLVRALNGDATQQRVLADGATGTYVAATDPSTSAPVILIDTSGHTPGAAQQTLNAIVTEVPKQLADLQKTLLIAPKNQIVASIITKDEAPKRSLKGQFRAVVAATVAALTLQAVLIGALDGWLTRRRPRQRALRPVDDTPDNELPSEDGPGRLRGAGGTR